MPITYLLTTWIIYSVHCAVAESCVQIDHFGVRIKEHIKRWCWRNKLILSLNRKKNQNQTFERVITSLKEQKVLKRSDLYFKYSCKHSRTNWYFLTGEWLSILPRWKIIILSNQRVKFTILLLLVWFTIFMNGLYSFQVNSTLFSTLSGHLFLFLHIFILEESSNLILWPIFTWVCWRKTSNLLPECDFNAVWVFMHCVTNESELYINFNRCFTNWAKFKIC